MSPAPEEMFSTLANGEPYSKLDLACTYVQTNEGIRMQSTTANYSTLPFGISTAPALGQQASVKWYAWSGMFY